MVSLYTIFNSVIFEVLILFKFVAVILFIKVFISPAITPHSWEWSIIVNICILMLIVVMMLSHEDEYDPNAHVPPEEGEVDEAPPANNPPVANSGHNRNYLVRFLTNLAFFILCGYLWEVAGFNKFESKKSRKHNVELKLVKFTFSLIVRNLISTMSAMSLFRFCMNMYWWQYAEAED